MSSRTAAAEAAVSVMTSSTAVEVADAGERDPPSLELSHDDRHRRGAVDQRQVGVGLDLVVGGEPGARGDPVDADHRDVEVEVGQAARPAGRPARRTRPGRRRRMTTSLMLGRTASSEAMLSELVTTRQAGHADQRAGDLGGGRAAVEPDRRALGRRGRRAAAAIARFSSP